MRLDYCARLKTAMQVPTPPKGMDNADLSLAYSNERRIVVLHEIIGPNSPEHAIPA